MTYQTRKRHADFDLTLYGSGNYSNKQKGLLGSMNEKHQADEVLETTKTKYCPEVAKSAGCVALTLAVIVIRTCS